MTGDGTRCGAVGTPGTKGPDGVAGVGGPRGAGGRGGPGAGGWAVVPVAEEVIVYVPLVGPGSKVPVSADAVSPDTIDGAEMKRSASAAADARTSVRAIQDRFLSGEDRLSAAQRSDVFAVQVQ